MHNTTYTSAEIGVDYEAFEPVAELEQPAETGLSITRRTHSILTELDMLVTSMIVDAANMDAHMAKQRKFNRKIQQVRNAIWAISSKSWNDGFQAGIVNSNDDLPF